MNILNKQANFCLNCCNSLQNHQNSKSWGCFGKFRKFALRRAQKFCQTVSFYPIIGFHYTNWIVQLLMHDVSPVSIPGTGHCRLQFMLPTQQNEKHITVFTEKENNKFCVEWMQHTIDTICSGCVSDAGFSQHPGLGTQADLGRVVTRASNEGSRIFHNHGEGSYKGLLLVESAYQCFYI